ncbi:MAG: protein kinase [bacterium]|nr:protein kinase [bacterium]
MADPTSSGAGGGRSQIPREQGSATTICTPAIPGYRIVGLLGEGGMGTVYLAEDEVLGRKVAVKVIAGALAGNASVQARERFLREARTMARVNHPNVARIYQLGERGDQVYMIMERIEGESLGQRIRRCGRLPPGEALELTRQIAEGLAAGWELGIIHRDVKPSNILIDREGEVKVVDFGLAKPVDAPAAVELTATGIVVGSPHYLSPEHASAKPTDFRSDVYSLGVVLFEMLTGRPPFAGDQAFAIVSQHLTSELPSPRAVRPDLPQGVCQLVAWMTAKDPAARPTSYAELLAKITALEKSGDRDPRPRPLTVRADGRGKGIRISLVAAVAVMLVVSLWFLRSPGSREPSPPAGGGQVAEPRGSPPVGIASFPGAAEVFVGDQRIGVTPLEWEPAAAAGEIRLRKPGYEPVTVAWKAGDERVFAHLRPEPLGIAPGAPGAELEPELERLATGAFGIELASAGGRRVRVRLRREGYPLLLWVTAGGDLYQLWPTELESAWVVPAERDTELPPASEPTLPATAAAGRLFFLVFSDPVPRAPIPGARPQPGRYTVYPRQVASRFPAHRYLREMIEDLRSGARDWDLTSPDA